jgi:hypothetical protein
VTITSTVTDGAAATHGEPARKKKPSSSSAVRSYRSLPATVCPAAANDVLIKFVTVTIDQEVVAAGERDELRSRPGVIYADSCVGRAL